MGNKTQYKTMPGTDKRQLERMKRPFGFNVVGYVSRNLGLGVMARNLTQLLLDKGCPVAIYDLNPAGLFRRADDVSYEKLYAKSCEELTYAINFFVVPIRDSTEFLFSNLSQLLSRRHCLNVFCPMWELATLPTIWIKASQLCDVIVAQSYFVRAACENYLSNTAIISAEHPLYFPTGVQASRSRFGLPGDVTLFVYSFEPRSDIERKNPLAVINAFKRAFRGSSPAQLVIKINNACYEGQTHSVVQTIKKLCNHDKRIHLITENLSYSEVLSLYASCDVFVSLHRSEGLGLGLMESMCLGKPVIATAWSGNMSFMNYTNSCLVRYKLIPAKGIIKCYNQQFMGKDAFWADPDLGEAIAWMRKLAEDANLRIRIGKKAAEDMRDYQKRAKQACFMKEIRAIWERRFILPNIPRNPSA